MGGWWTALGVLVAASGSACGSASDRQVPVSIAIASASPSTPTAPVVTPCKNLVECSRSCERKEARSCGRLGEMYSLGAGVERDPLKAKAALERGCDLGGGDACATLAQLQRETGRAGAEVSASAARACEAGAGAGCSMLEPMVRHGLDIPIDLARADQLQAKALKLLATSCDAGDFNACFQLSPLVWDGVGAAADPAAGAKLKRRGMELQRRACANGDVLACDAAARRASADAFATLSESPEAVDAHAALRRACALDALDACEVLSLQGEVDPNERRSFREKACALGDAKSCFGASSEDLRAREEMLLKRDCDAGYGAACRELADYLDLEDAPREEIESARKKARISIVAACRAGADSCYEAATLLEMGVGGPPDDKEIQAVLEIPCRTTGFCGALAERLVKSNDPKARARGLELLQREAKDSGKR